jgi:hypothetical protein
MFFESHFKLESSYGKPFAAFPKGDGKSYLVWYADDRNNVYALEVWVVGKDEGAKVPKPVLAIEQPRESARMTRPSS